MVILHYCCLILSQSCFVCSSWAKVELDPGFYWCCAWLFCTMVRHKVYVGRQGCTTGAHQQNSWYEENSTSWSTKG